MVYEVHDRELGARVALKRLKQRLWPEAILRFKSEFRAIEDVEHPNLVSLGELFEEDGHWFFTMELIDGVDFFTWVRTKPEPEKADDATDQEKTTHDDVSPETVREESRESMPAPVVGFDERRLRRALIQLLLGLDALHSGGKVHRDVKPSNVMVTPEGRVVLLDFGLAVDAILGIATPVVATRERSEGVVGTLSYMAPEQALGVRVDARADMYSVGVVLYRALTGRLPFNSPPPPGMPRVIIRPSVIAEGVPIDLDALCMQLLDSSPENRPSAPDAIARIGDEASAQNLTSISPPAPRRFFGRELELATLAESFDRTLHGDCAAICVTGESGLGKTTLVRRFGETVAAEYGAVVLTSRCYERESVPYKAVDGVADALARWLTRLPESEVRALVPMHAARLAQAFPSLRAALLESRDLTDDPPPKDPRERRAQLFTAARDLFTRLSARFPLVLVVDDLQWGGADSIALLHEALRPPNAPSVLLIATMRDHPEGMTRAIREDATEIALGPLDRRDARDLAASALAGLHHGRMIDAIVLEGGGHPLFIETLARGLLARTEATLRAPRLDDTLAAVVARLDPSARAVVEATCVAAAPLRADVLAMVIDEKPSLNEPRPLNEIARVVRGLQVARLVRTRGTGRARTIEAYHDRIRHAVFDRIAEAERRAWHTKIGDALELLDPENVDAMASHFLAADDRVKAARWLRVSSENAFRALAFDRVAMLERERLSLNVLDDDEARAARTRLGEALVAAGRGAEAANAFLAASASANTNADDALDLKRRAAEQLLVSGHIDRGLATLEPVLDATGSKIPRTRAAAAASFAWGRARLKMRGLAYELRNEADVKPELLRRIDAYAAAAAALGMVDTIRGADFQTRHLLTALEAGEARRLVRALAIEAAFSASTGTAAHERTTALLALADRVANEAIDDHPMSRVLPLSAHGFAAFLEGNWIDARDHLAKSITLLRTECEGAGMAFALVNANLYSLGALIHLGELAEIERRLPALLDDATLRGDRYALTQMRTGVAAYIALARGDLDTATRETSAAMDGWSRGTHMPHFFDALARVQIDLYAGNVRAAHTRAEEAARSLRKAMLFRVQFVRVKMTELRARTALALSLEDRDARASLLQSFDREISALYEEGAPWAIALADLASATREAAYGSPDAARRRFAAAAVKADRSHMALHAAIARVRMGGDEGRVAEDWLRAQHVGDAACFVRTLSPH